VAYPSYNERLLPSRDDGDPGNLSTAIKHRENNVRRLDVGKINVSPCRRFQTNVARRVALIVVTSVTTYEFGGEWTSL